MASQIKTFGMAKMTIGSASDFHSKVLGFITSATPAALHIENFASAYAPAVDTLASIVNRQRSFVSTESMREADKKRDHASGVICKVTQAYLTSPVTEKSAAAHLLYPQLSPYTGIRSHEYTKQTAEVKGMLAVLDEPTNKTAVTTLGLTAEVEALRSANAAFESVFLTKASEMSERMEQSSIKSDQILAQTTDLYANIVSTVNAYAIVQPSDVILTFINNVNGLVGIYSHIAGGGSQGGTTPGGSDTPVTPDPPVTPPDGGDGGGEDVLG